MPLPDPSLTLVLFDDAAAARWEPFALTRPAGELLFGTMTLRARAERVFGARCVAHLAADHLQGFEEEGAPPVLRYAEPPAEGERLFLSSRSVPAWGSGELWRERRGGAGAVLIGTEVVGWYAPEGTPPPGDDYCASPGGLVDRTGAVVLPGKVLGPVWELMSLNPAQISEDVAALFPGAETAKLPEGSYAFGEHPVIVGDGAVVEPGVVFDVSSGPVWLDEGSRVRALSRIEGPVYLGRGSTILGGTLVQSSIGPVCKIRGEFAESVAVGW
ncbi:MAG: putative sugar nucleotidyl transferase, partial [Longimicrobiaceae bacterium]